MPISDTVFRPGVAVLVNQNPVEVHVGSDCTLTDGATSRVLTVTKTLYSSAIIVVDGMVMRPTTQAVISGQTIRFVDALPNASTIEVY